MTRVSEVAIDTGQRVYHLFMMTHQQIDVYLDDTLLDSYYGPFMQEHIVAARWLFNLCEGHHPDPAREDLHPYLRAIQAFE